MTRLSYTRPHTQLPAYSSLVIALHQAFLHPTATVDALAAVLPSGFGAPLAIIRNWT